jgi:soluble lytic murein transglycosylase-like protein
MGFLFALLTLAMSPTPPAHAEQKTWSCWEEAASRHNLDPVLLYAIARVETGARSGVVSGNTNGSYDIGVMQINSSWLPRLAKVGITAQMLRDKPCLNVKVGAWILSDTINRYGMNWRGVGAYNATTDWKRARYARKVAAELRRIQEKHRKQRAAQGGVLVASADNAP